MIRKFLLAVAAVFLAFASYVVFSLVLDEAGENQQSQKPDAQKAAKGDKAAMAPNAAPPAKEEPSTADSAYRLCAWFDTTKLLSQKCEVGSRTVDITIDMPADESGELCARLSGMMPGPKWWEFDRDWQLRVFTPHSARPIASCDL